MSVGAEAMIYNCHSMDVTDSGPTYPQNFTVHNGVKNTTCSSKKYHKATRSMSTCVPSSSYEALRYAVAALNRLDDFNCEKIGAGFFSEVFKVTHRTTGQVMVLKMNTSFSNRANMLREVQLMNRLSHENILRFMGVCVHEGQLHALTEYINGGSLEQLLQSKHLELSWETRIKLSLDIARGMCYLHSRGVFHRDLTSKNVLIKIAHEEMTAVVGDFGLAEKIPDPRDRSQRLPIVGSPYWMAPECLKGLWYNEKADVFSFGIIMCEIIARIEADPDILPRTENFGVDYVAFSDMCPDCPPQFLELAFTSCRIDPESRPSFKETVHQLEKMLNVISSMSGGSHLFYPPVVYTSCWDDGDNIDSVRAIFVHGWNRVSPPQNKVQSLDLTPAKAANSSIPQTPVTPKHVGEAMSLWDPHYKPGNSSYNPFASLPRFWKGKKFLEPSLSDVDLAHSADYDFSSSKSSRTPSKKSEPRPVISPSKLKLSKSLPSSPIAERRSLSKLFSNLCNDIPDSPRSVSPCPFSTPSSMSPFEPDDSFSGYSSVQEQMSDCKLEDRLQEVVPSRVPQPPPEVVTFRTKTPSLCAKLRRSSGESGFFSVGDRNSTCDLSLESCPADLQMTLPDDRTRPPSCYSDTCHSSTAEDIAHHLTLGDGVDDISDQACYSQAGGDVDHLAEGVGGQPAPIGGRKRPSSCYSDDSCYCGHHSPANSDQESSKDPVSLPVCPRASVQSVCDCSYGHVLSKHSSHSGGVESDPELSNFDSDGVLSKMCEKGKRVAKCMRTSAD